MDRIPRGVRNFLFTILTKPVYNYQLLLISLLLISKSDFDADEYGLMYLYNYVTCPSMWLIWVIRIFVLLYPMLQQLPIMTEDNLIYMTIFIYLHITNSRLLRTNFKSLCSIFSSHYYESGIEDYTLIVHLLFVALQLIVITNITFSAWFCDCLKRVLLAGRVVVNFILKDLLIILSIGNILSLIVQYNMQNLAVVIVCLQIIWELILEFVLVAPTMDTVITDFCLYLEDEEIEEDDSDSDSDGPTPSPMAFHVLELIENDYDYGNDMDFFI